MLLAEINATRDGINVRSRLSGADFTIGENGGTTATQLGIRSYTGDTELAAFNRGVGVPTDVGPEALDTAKFDQIQIVARDNGTLIVVDLSTATSLQDVVNLINTAAGNNVGTTAVLARMTQTGNGIELVDSSTANVNDSLQVNAPPGSEAAEYLGVRLAPERRRKARTSTRTRTETTCSPGDNVVENDLVIVARDGTATVRRSGGRQDRSRRDRSHQRQSGTTRARRPITARLAATGNGIELVDAPLAAGRWRSKRPKAARRPQYLGFVAQRTRSNPAMCKLSAHQVLTSEDRHTHEADSVFNTLLRLQTALRARQRRRNRPVDRAARRGHQPREFRAVGNWLAAAEPGRDRYAAGG